MFGLDCIPDLDHPYRLPLSLHLQKTLFPSSFLSTIFDNYLHLSHLDPPPAFAQDDYPLFIEQCLNEQLLLLKCLFLLTKHSPAPYDTFIQVSLLFIIPYLDPFPSSSNASKVRTTKAPSSTITTSVMGSFRRVLSDKSRLHS